jgi:SAM-dependent methyltransferase
MQMDGLPPHPHPASRAVLEPDDLYASPPPWDIGRPQPGFRALADAGALTGPVLDAGCGTGEHVLMCAALGLDATGIDLAGNALGAARQKARDRGLSARFLRHDARNLAALRETFDTVLDCGLFHIFTDDERAAYAAGLRTALAPGGRYFMLCLSDRDPGTWGGRMRKVTRGEITATFADGWRTGTIEPATIEITTAPGGIRAWLAALTRI